MKEGSFVQLKKSAIKKFYGTEKNAEYFEIGGEISPKHFVDYVHHIIGFEDGVMAGRVIDFNSNAETVKVELWSPIKGFTFCYYCVDDLKVVE